MRPGIGLWNLVHWWGVWLYQVSMWSVLQVKKVYKNIGLAFVYLKEKELGWRIFASSVF